jgi:hypothetical protein
MSESDPGRRAVNRTAACLIALVVTAAAAASEKAELKKGDPSYGDSK